MTTSQSDFSEEAARRDYKPPYSGHNHQIPTIQRYREHRSELDEQRKQAEEAQRSEGDDSKPKRAVDSVKAIFKDEDKQTRGDPYPTANRNSKELNCEPIKHDSSIPGPPSAIGGQAQTRSRDGTGSARQDDTIKSNGNRGQSATERVVGQSDPKQKRKEMKNNKRDDGGRIVTDPVTHLPIVIRDSTTKDLDKSPENEPSPGLKNKTATGSSGLRKTSSQLDEENEELQQNYEGMQKVFPPPSFDDVKAELVRTYQSALTFAIGTATTVATSVVLLLLVVQSQSHPDSTKNGSWWSGSQPDQPRQIFIPLAVTITIALGIGVPLVWVVQGWLGKKVEEIWEDEVWDAARLEEQESNRTEARLPESVAWANGLLALIWPLINPDLFASVADMLEDVMQASLPKVVRMVSVDDLGQGSEALRILGIRWLPTGAASQSVDEAGNLKPASDKDTNDRAAPGEGEEEDNEDKDKDKDEENPEASKKKRREKQQKEQEQQALREGMEAEQGDFVNMEIGFSYRARSSGKSLKSKAKNAHL